MFLNIITWCPVDCWSSQGLPRASQACWQARASRVHRLAFICPWGRPERRPWIMVQNLSFRARKENVCKSSRFILRSSCPLRREHCERASSTGPGSKSVLKNNNNNKTLPIAFTSWSADLLRDWVLHVSVLREQSFSKQGTCPRRVS